MSKLLTVVGATGIQGGSVITAALKEGTWKVRGITRNVNSDAAKALTAQGVEMVSANLNDEQSLRKAFQGSTAIYAVTDFFEPFAASGPSAAIEIESTQGINLARAASATPTLQHYIWSTLPNGAQLSGGKYVVPHFEAKNRVDAHIRADASLRAKTTFLWVTFYASNFLYPMFTPNLLKSSGKYLQLSPAAASTPVVTIGDARANVGAFAVAILRRPGAALGKVVLAKTGTLSAGGVLDSWSRATGHAAEYVRVSLEQFDAVWPGWGREMGVMLAFWDEAKERSWSGEEVVVGPEELGVEVESLVGLEDAFRRTDWSGVL
jgi:uncharacterized protein YbjT (DUF2867 family)